MRSTIRDALARRHAMAAYAGWAQAHDHNADEAARMGEQIAVDASLTAETILLRAWRAEREDHPWACRHGVALTDPRCEGCLGELAR